MEPNIVPYIDVLALQMVEPLVEVSGVWGPYDVLVPQVADQLHNDRSMSIALSNLFWLLFRDREWVPSCLLARNRQDAFSAPRKNAEGCLQFLRHVSWAWLTDSERWQSTRVFKDAFENVKWLKRPMVLNVWHFASFGLELDPTFFHYCQVGVQESEADILSTCAQ